MNSRYYGIIGLVLVIAGVIIIGYGLWRAYAVFSGAVPLPSFYEKKPATTISKEFSFSIPGTKGEFKIGLPLNIEEKVGTTGNVTIQYLLILLIFMGGGRIAGIGISLLKNPKAEGSEK